ncbi:MAG: autotransporter-associated beta strand repeat-containing protein, partial [Verrucomicrobiota bacterium]
MPVARATSVTNADTGGPLTVGSSWIGGVAPSATSVAVWDTNITTATPGNATSTLGGAASWEGVQVLNPAEPIVIGADGNTLTLGASGIDMSMATNSLTLSCLVGLGANQNWNVTNGQTLTIGGVVSGTGILTINNNAPTNGTVILNAFDNYTGGTVINGGVIVPGSAGSFSTVGGVTMNSGTTLLLSTLASGGILTNAFTVNGTCVIDTFNRGVSLVLDGQWSGSGTVIVTNAASGLTLTFGGNGYNAAGTATSGSMNNFTGAIVVTTNASGTASAGNIRFNNGGSSPNLGNALMTLDLGSGSCHFTEKNSGTTTSFGAVYGGPNTELAQPENYVIGGLNITNAFGGTIQGASSLTKTGTGILILTNVSPYTGATTVSSGALQIGDGNVDASLAGASGLSGTSGVAISSGASLIFNRPDSYPVAFNISGAGATIITGGGTNTYSGADTASGTTSITNGDLVLTGKLTSPIYVAGSGTFDVSQLGSGFTLVQALSGTGTVTNNGPFLAGSGSSLSPGGSGTAGTLTIDGGLTESGSVNNQFSLSAPGSTNDLIAVAGSLALSGLNTITLSDFRGGSIPNGVYPLITYTGSFSGTLTGANSNLTITAVGVTGTLTNITSVTPNEIAVIISPASRPATNLTWVGDGVNNYWDTSSSGDWKAGGTFFTFQAGDSALFTDGGAPNTNVVLQATVLPGAVVVSNSTLEHYTFTDNGTGLGILSGATGLIKTNSGVLTILNTNSYTGITLVEEGALEVTNVVNGGLDSPIGAATSDPSNLVFSASTFQFSGASAAMDRGITSQGGVIVNVTNASTTLTENGVVAGAGALTKVGLGTLTLANANTYAGGTVISNGVLAAANQTANASGFGPSTSPITFYGGTLALYHNNGDDGSTTFSFSNPLIVPAGQTGTLEVFQRGDEGGPLTGTGTLNVSATGVRGAFSGDWSAFTGTINITGNFRIATTTGYSNAVIMLNGGADLDGGTDAGTYSSNPNFDIGELDATNLTTLATLGAVSKPTPNPTWRVGWKNTTSLFFGTIENPSGGIASITKVGAGAWFLGGQNTYTGATTISNGTLLLTNVTGSDGSIGDSTNIFINAGAVLDVTGVSTGSLALNSGQVLSGSGSINGSLSPASGSTIIPGGSSATGTLTISNGLTETGGVNHQFMLSTGGNPDLINVVGTLNVSGANTITLSELGGGQIPPGVYPLISYGAINGGTNNFTLADGGTVFFSGVVTNITSVTPNEIGVVIQPLPPATNLTWVGDGVNNNWDYLTTDWAAGSTPFAFEPGDSVLFTDSGSASPPVNLTTTLFPATVVVSNSAENYTFTDNGTGLGNLSGSTGLIKTNTGTLTILNSNSYAGATIFGEGVVEVTNMNNSLEPSPLGAANNDPSNMVFYAGTLRFSGASAGTDHGMTSLGEATVDVTNATTTLTNNGAVAGAGGLIKIGLGTLAMGGAGSYTGGTVISNGTLALASQNANNNGAGKCALGSTNSAVTFMGTNFPALQLYGYGLLNSDDYNIFYNPLVVPTNQTGTLLMYPRTASSPGLLSKLTGGGTLTVVANFVRSWMGGDWSQFTGLIIVTNLNTGQTANLADAFEIDNTNGYAKATFWLQGVTV